MKTDTKTEYELRNAILDEIIKFGPDNDDDKILQKNIDEVCEQFGVPGQEKNFSSLTNRSESSNFSLNWDTWRKEQLQQIEELEKDLPEFKKDKQKSCRRHRIFRLFSDGKSFFVKQIFCAAAAVF